MKALSFRFIFFLIFLNRFLNIFPSILSYVKFNYETVVLYGKLCKINICRVIDSKNYQERVTFVGNFDFSLLKLQFCPKSNCLFLKSFREHWWQIDITVCQLSLLGNTSEKGITVLKVSGELPKHLSHKLYKKLNTLMTSARLCSSIINLFIIRSRLNKSIKIYLI